MSTSTKLAPLRVGSDVEIVEAIPRGTVFLEGFVTKIDDRLITVRIYKKGTIAKFDVKTRRVVRFSYPAYALIVRRKEKRRA